VHPRIQDEPFSGSFEVVTVGADLCPAREIDEFQQREDERCRLTRATAKFEVV
jgi:hypothetical protein